MLLLWCILFIVFSSYKVPWFLIAYFNLSLATHILDEKDNNFWKLLVHHWKSSNIALFMEQPVYIIFKVENVSSLACWFSFDTSCLNSMYKPYIFVLEFWVLCESGIDIFLFVEHPIYSIFNVQSVLILDCWFYFVTSYPNSSCKTFLFSKFRCSAKETTLLIGHPAKWSEFC